VASVLPTLYIIIIIVYYARSMPSNKPMFSTIVVAFCPDPITHREFRSVVVKFQWRRQDLVRGRGTNVREDNLTTTHKNISYIYLHSRNKHSIL